MKRNRMRQIEVLSLFAALGACGLLGCSVADVGSYISCEASDCPDGLVCVDNLCQPPEVCVGENCGTNGNNGNNGNDLGTNKENVCDPVCTGDAQCVDGACLCAGVECAAGLQCVKGQCLCGTESCDLTTHICENNTCQLLETSLCADVICDAGESCVESTGQCAETACIVNGEEKSCGDGEFCTKGECVSEVCRNVDCGSESCVDVDGKAVCACGGEVCGDGANCVEGKCVNPCDDVVCENGEVCVYGACSCDGKGRTCDINEGEVCVDGACIVDQSCGICDNGLVCVNGECVCGGLGRACGEDEVCHYGTCLAIECVDVVCEKEGYVCDAGACVPAACSGIVCPEGTFCSVTGQCVFEACVDVTCPSGQVCQSNGTCVFENAPKFILSSSSTTTREDDEANGKTTEVHVSFDKKPAQNVTVKATVSSESEARIVSTSELTFTTDNYSMPQTLVLAGVRDDVIDGDQKYSLDLVTESDAEVFNGVAASMEFTNIDVDKAAVVITSVGSTTTDEAGGKAVFKVVLASKPTDAVTFTVTSSDTNEGVVEPAEFTFTPENWNKEQFMTVTGVADNADDGDKIYYLEFGLTASTDPDYKGLLIEPIKLVNIDNDEAGVRTDVTRLSIKEGESGVIGVSLKIQPEYDVTVSAVILGEDDTEAIVETVGGVTFTAEDYAEVKNIQINGLLDDVVDGDQTWTLRLIASSEDRHYDKKEVEVDGTTVDVDTADILIGNCVSAATIAEGESFVCELKLSSQPQNSVAVKAASSDAAFGASVSPDEASFAKQGTDWSEYKTFTITGTKDDVVDDINVSTISFELVTDDANFNGKKVTKSVTVTDINTPEIILPSSYEMNLSEANATTSYNIVVKLGGKPASDVTIRAVLTDVSEVAVSPATALMTPEMWNSGVTFTYKAVDDVIVDGAQKAQLSFSSTSSDALFNGRSALTGTITVADNDQPDIVVTEGITKVECQSSASSNTMQIRLSTEPTSGVELAFELQDAAGNRIDNVTNGISISPKTMSFSPSNWEANQTMTITGPKAGSIPAQTYYGNVYLVAKETAKLATGYAGGTFKAGSLFSLKAFCDPGTITSDKTLTLPKGRYVMTVLGAGGGSYTTSMPSARYGGAGGMATAQFRLVQTKTAYVKIGGGGSRCFYNHSCGGANGGSPGTYSVTTQYGAGGGGATDIRLGANDMAHRVIVGAGGGGGMYGPLVNTSDGSNGGGFKGDNGKYNKNANSATPGGGQNGCNDGSGKGTICLFGVASAEPSGNLRGGGGGGWYTGATGQEKKHSGAGGSSFIYGNSITGSNYTSAGGVLTANDVVYVSGASTQTGQGAPHDTNGSATITVVSAE